MEYTVKLSCFEGPMDLLLHLIGKAKIDIEEIFVSQITDQYLEYMEDIHELDMDKASEFLQMAATLVHIKSKALLPAKRREEELDEDGLTEEQRLIQNLKEYKKYKEAMEQLRTMESENKKFFRVLEGHLSDQNLNVHLVGLELDELIEAYQKVLRRVEKRRLPVEPSQIRISHDVFSVRNQAKLILARLTIKNHMTFLGLFEESATKMEVAVTFLALLDLLTKGKVSISQDGCFQNIYISKKVQ